MYGRRHVATKALPPSGGGRSTLTAGAARPRAAPSAATAGPTSATERGDIECSATPAACSASASSMRFSSSFTTTRSGARATIASTSGFFVPPTIVTPGRSQNRVTATGVTPSATSVSVALGTNETTLTSHAFEELGFLRLELLGRDHTLVAQRRELVDLLGDGMA